jgi:hypothetical protein
MVKHNTSDVDRDLVSLETYAIASILGCGALCLALCAIGCAVWAAVAWL